MCERLFWRHLNDKQLGFRFRRQFGIGPYVVDFYSPKLHLAIEIDGPTHEPTSDVIRQKQIEDLGITVIRFTNRQILTQIEEVLSELGKVISSCQSSPFRRGK